MRDASSSISLSHYFWSELSAIAEFIEGAEEGRGGICRYCSCSFVSICRSKTSVSVHSLFPFSYKEWVSSPGLVVSIDLTFLSGICLFLLSSHTIISLNDTTWQNHQYLSSFFKVAFSHSFLPFVLSIFFIIYICMKEPSENKLK